jgi:FixJ family two-component response regulator
LNADSVFQSELTRGRDNHMPNHTNIYLVEDDGGDRRELAFRLGAGGIETWTFVSASSFLTAAAAGLQPQLILLAVDAAPNARDMVGELRRREIDWPIIALSRDRDIALAIDMMKQGILDFFLKPVDEVKLVAAIRSGTDRLVDQLAAREAARTAKSRVKALTTRETSVCTALLAGQPNKVIAYNLGISIRTVEAHRSNIMMKLAARNFAEVFVLLTQAGLRPAPLSTPVTTRQQLTGIPSVFAHPASNVQAVEQAL